MLPAKWRSISDALALACTVVLITACLGACGDTAALPVGDGINEWSEDASHDGGHEGETDTSGLPDISEESDDAARDADDAEDASWGDACFWFGENAGNCLDGDTDDDGEEDEADADEPEDPTPPWEICPSEYTANSRETCHLKNAALTSVSGIAASRLTPGIIWMHNDHPKEELAHAVDPYSGETIAVIKMPEGMSLFDVEDMAIARCPWDENEDLSDDESPGLQRVRPVYGGPTCLWFADTGNNNTPKRDTLSLVIIREPELEIPAALSCKEENFFTPDVITPEEFSQIFIRYPDESCDAESLVVEPDGSAFALFEKVPPPEDQEALLTQAQEAQLFTAQGPFEDGQTVTLSKVGTVRSHPLSELSGGNLIQLLPKDNSYRKYIEQYGQMMTGADLHPSRKKLVLRTYMGVFEYNFESPNWMFELTTRGEADFSSWFPNIEISLFPSLEIKGELQGEAVSYTADGRNFWTVSEDKNQKPGQGIHGYSCDSDD